MKTDDGRQWATREDLIEHSGYSRTTLTNLWLARESNGHPEAHTIDGVMHWDLKVWTEWLAEHRRHRPRDEDRVDRSGDPDEELPPAGQARVLGIDPSRITQYEKNPPVGWPDPVRIEELPTRIRRWRTRRQLWQFADEHPLLGTVGRPPGPETKPRASKTEGSDPRIRVAAEALASQPDRKVREVAADLAREHGQSVDTWKRIITEARKRTQQ
ncbi:hypothetical protein [Streptomyces rubradiris]|uniref:Lsr2 protein n=1 Tax=Streptomyces rubradiris TaxID=285531 RepID=A0ABQ3RA74_STRRR|nr:hypothetical protein [Streptomyces rubradiris]GHH25898.1 hypothetical protein GCM10018792_65630 [Streptomyces rubradiris]GHI52768.1 hypothetical protein Srubr_26140 [Streptomyces rubradiris]